MSERNAEFVQVGIAEQQQDFEINVVLGEDRASLTARTSARDAVAPGIFGRFKRPMLLLSIWNTAWSTQSL